MARPRGGNILYTDALADEVIAGIATGLTDKDAAAAAGISEDTFGRWMKGQRGAPADLAERVSRTRKQRARLWLGEIRTIAKDTRDWRAYAELLDRCAPEYRKRQSVELSGPDGGPLQIAEFEVVRSRLPESS